ncbi:MAG: helix-turn-helix domain-containing protein [Acidobacteria bacterium]|nr:MAG: helix-turn-helix domain-containing protein [Acidobacteriota bacterium]
MIAADKRQAVFLLHQEGMSLQEIAQRLQISRNTVHTIIAQKGEMPLGVRQDKIQIDGELLERLYQECEGWVQRVHEKLMEEQGIRVGYSTLTRMLRQLEMNRSQTSRCQHVPDQPGAEMQHDTSPYAVQLGDLRVQVIASLLYLRYSKRRYLRFYRLFNRFRMKCFLHEALMFWRYAARVCIIDNTNLARWKGTGRDAVIVPEMEAFAKQYGFRFVCHEKGHANRKAGEERSFWTVETNFFPGRHFQSLEDLNQQAFQWATVRMEQRPVAKSKLIPAQAFQQERSALIALPAHLPAPYCVHERGTDQYGYAAFKGNCYWVPGTKRQDVKVVEYSDLVKIYQSRRCLVEYDLPADGVSNQRISPEGMPKPAHQPKDRKRASAEEERRLRALSPTVEKYLHFVFQPGSGLQRHRFIRELLQLAERMTPALFLETLERALHYAIRDLPTLQRIARLSLSQGQLPLGPVEVDENFSNRDTYQQGRWTEVPDFSPYDQMLEDQSDEQDQGNQQDQKDEEDQNNHG